MLWECNLKLLISLITYWILLVRDRAATYRLNFQSAHSALPRCQLPSDIARHRFIVSSSHRLMASEQEINKRLRSLHQDFDFLLDNNVISTELYDNLVQQIPRRILPSKL